MPIPKNPPKLIVFVTFKKRQMLKCVFTYYLSSFSLNKQENLRVHTLLAKIKQVNLILFLYLAKNSNVFSGFFNIRF